MAKKHWILSATVAAGLAVGAPAAMAAPLPEPPAVPAAPAAPALPALPGAPGGQAGGDCSDEPGTAQAQSDAPALQLPVAGVSHLNENCQSAGNDQGNGAGGDVAFPPGLPQ